MTSRSLATAIAVACLALVSAAHAHHISGTLYCDVDYDGIIDGGDSRLSGITVRAVSQDVNPGETFTDGTDGSGFYSIGLPARTDRYLVMPIGLPGGWTIVVPASGSYLIQIITQSSQDHADDVNFLVQGCAPPPTTTSSSTTQPTTSSTSSSTSSSSSSSTSSSTSTTSSTAAPTTTTVPGQCDCTLAFFTSRLTKFNNDGTINGNAAVNSPNGLLKLGKGVFMPDGTSLKGDYVEVGNGSSVYDVFARTAVKTGFEAVIRHDLGPLVLPIADPFCEIPDFTCGGTAITVPYGETQTIAPGVYGIIRVMNGGTLQLGAGTYTVCDVKMGREARIEATGAVTLRIVENLRIGTASYFGPVGGAPLIDTYVAGRKVRVSQSALAVARIVAPFAQATFGRDSALNGCFCSDRAKSDKHITLTCIVQ
jgi:hypothetical protein